MVGSDTEHEWGRKSWVTPRFLAEQLGHVAIYGEKQDCTRGWCMGKQEFDLNTLT